MRYVDRTGEKIGDAVVLHRVGKRGANTLWAIRCGCGAVIERVLVRGKQPRCDRCLSSARSAAYVRQFRPRWGGAA